MENVATNLNNEQFQKVVPLKLGETLCYPVFLCLHSKNPGTEQLKKDLSRYRSTKQILKQLFVEGQNYEASDEWLHSKLFAEKTEGLRLIWEYTNMMFLSLSSEESLNRFARERTKIAELNAFHEKFNTLPMSEEKTLISLFRSAMGMDSFVEELIRLEEQAPQRTNVARNDETRRIPATNEDQMEIQEARNLRELYVDPMEKFMDEYVGTATELRGRFKIHSSNIVDDNLQQIICSTAKETFEKTEGRINLFGLKFTVDEQISYWVNRTEETWRTKNFPVSVEGYMQINDRKEQFNFLKSLDIANINAEVENLHPSTHEFWENSTIKKEFIDFLKAFS